MWMVVAFTGRLKVQIGWPGLRDGGQAALSLYSSSEPHAHNGFATITALQTLPW